jgi:hypothetical protein
VTEAVAAVDGSLFFVPIGVETIDADLTSAGTLAQA